MRLHSLLALGLLLLPGCAGYHVGPVKPSAMAHVQKLAVPSFKNSTLEPRLEVLMANALIKQIQQDGSYQITSERDADAVIEGSIDRIERTPLRGSRSNSNSTSPQNTYADFYQTTEFSLNLLVSIKVVEKNSGVTLASRNAKGSASFFVSGSNPRTANVNRDELQAVPQAAEDAAVRLTSYLSEGW